MQGFQVELEEDEARRLYRWLHNSGGQTTYESLYLQLQKHFFATLTIRQLQQLLEAEE